MIQRRTFLIGLIGGIAGTAGLGGAGTLAARATPSLPALPSGPGRSADAAGVGSKTLDLRVAQTRGTFGSSRPSDPPPITCIRAPCRLPRRRRWWRRYWW